MSVAIPSIASNSVLVVIALLVAYVTWSEGTNEAYLFPKVVSVVLVVSSLVCLISGLFSRNEPVRIEAEHIRLVVPGLLLMVLLVMTAEWVGFYLSGYIFLIAVSYWYSPYIRLQGKSRLLPSLIKDICITLAFIGVMYVLFSVLLQVQVPSGWLV